MLGQYYRDVYKRQAGDRDRDLRPGRQQRREFRKARFNTKFVQLYKAFKRKKDLSNFKIISLF